MQTVSCMRHVRASINAYRKPEHICVYLNIYGGAVKVFGGPLHLTTDRVDGPLLDVDRRVCA